MPKILIKFTHTPRLTMQRKDDLNRNNLDPGNPGNEDDEACLLDDETPSVNITPDVDDVISSGKKCCPGFRFFWAEMVVFLYAFCDFPINLVTQKYTLEWMTQYNWDQDILHNVTHNFSISDNNSDISPCLANSTSPEYAFNQRNQLMASYFSILRMTTWVIPAILSNLILGSASDKLGKKWVFVPPVLGGFLYCIALIFLTYFKATVFWLLITDFLVGFSGSFGCILLASVAFVIEQTTSSNRLFRLTLLQLFALIGASISPFAMGPLLSYTGAPLTILVTSSVSLLNLLYCLIFIPNRKVSSNSGILVVDDDESLVSDVVPYNPNKKQASDSLRTINSVDGVQSTNSSNGIIDSPSINDDTELIGAGDTASTSICSLMTEYVRNTFKVYSSGKRKHIRTLPQCAGTSGIGNISTSINSQEAEISRSLTKDQKELLNIPCRLRILLLAFFIVVIPAFDGVVLTLFELNSPLCWTPSTIGIYTGVAVSITALGSLILTPLFERYFSHITVAIISCFACAGSRIYLFFVKDTLMMFLGAGLTIFNMMLVPSIRTMMTLLVDESNHGAILGSIEAVEILCCLLAGVLFNVVYSATLMISTSLVFLVSASIFLLGAFIFIGYRIKYGTKETSVIING